MCHPGWSTTHGTRCCGKPARVLQETTTSHAGTKFGRTHDGARRAGKKTACRRWNHKPCGGEHELTAAHLESSVWMAAASPVRRHTCSCSTTRAATTRGVCDKEAKGGQRTRPLQNGRHHFAVEINDKLDARLDPMGARCVAEAAAGQIAGKTHSQYEHEPGRRRRRPKSA